MRLSSLRGDCFIRPQPIPHTREGLTMTTNTKQFTNRSYLDALDQRVLLFDGAMGTNLDRQHLTVDDFGGERMAGCNDYLVVSKPQAVEIVPPRFS